MPGLGRDEEPLLRRAAARSSTMPSVERICVRSFANAIAWLAQPHSGCTSSSASGASSLPALDVGGADAGVDVALAEPDRQLAAGHALEPEAEVHVRAGTGSPGRPGSPRSPPARCRRCSSSRSRPSPRRSCSRRRRRPRRGASPSRRAAARRVIDAASEQPASRSGISTVLSGLRIVAVSAMKWTPQKTIVAASVAAAWRERPSESPT